MAPVENMPMEEEMAPAPEEQGGDVKEIIFRLRSVLDELEMAVGGTGEEELPPEQPPEEPMGGGMGRQKPGYRTALGV